ncbi:MAG TPA: LytTR family DNA-binding domain-containing protein [Terracidiphilus sp.]|nr:LytTR family DNA-binding domain-containing protein [Terracidiphilus sp.]
MRVLIVDDEPLARSALERALRGRNDIETLDSAKDAIQALEMMQEATYDVLLLDIRMPELSGIDLADRLNKSNQPIPSIIFVTAHDQHAVAAFENHADDYVLKPFSSARVNRALNVALRRTENDRAARLLRTLHLLETPLAKPHFKVAIKGKGRILFIDPDEMAVIRADGNYVLLEKRSGSYLLRESLSTVAEKLKPHGFIRIHRSVLVNTSFVEEIQPWPTGEYVLKIKGGQEFTVTRMYKNNLKSIAQLWVGTDAFS